MSELSHLDELEAEAIYIIREVSSRNLIISLNFQVVSMCINGNGGFSG